MDRPSVVGLVALAAVLIHTVVTLLSSRSARWEEHARTTQVLLWGGLLLGLPADLSCAWLSGASFFCF